MMVFIADAGIPFLIIQPSTCSYPGTLKRNKASGDRRPWKEVEDSVALVYLGLRFQACNEYQLNN
jgi:hypothetical protein